MWQEPIFDRTNADTLTARAGQSNIDNHKGALNYQDLNRIEENFQYVVNHLFDNAMIIPHRLRNFTETVLEYVQTGEAGPEYTLVEHLESTGEQFIDTGYRPTSDNLRVVIHFKYTQSHSGLSLFGNHTSVPYSVGVYGSKPQFYVGSGSSGIDCGPTTSLNTRYELDISVKNGTLITIWNGVTYTAAYSGSLYKDLPFYIFGSNSNGTLAENDNGYLLYKIQFYDNDALVRDFIPVIDANDEACLYDQLNRVYYRNKGTGTFTAGPEVPVETDPVYELIETKKTYTDWQEQNIPWKSEIDRIRENFNSLTNLFLRTLNLPIFKSSDYLMYDEVNDWEYIAFVGKQMFENMEKEYIRCGTINCGGDTLL